MTCPGIRYMVHVHFGTNSTMSAHTLESTGQLHHTDTSHPPITGQATHTYMPDSG